MQAFLYKPDWEETKERLTAWWNQDPLDRALICVEAPLDNPPPISKPPQPQTSTERWCNLEYLAQRNEYMLSRTFFGGEAIPVWNPGYPGHSDLPTFYGCMFQLDWEGGIHIPLLSDSDFSMDIITQLKLDKNGKWWTFAYDLLTTAREEAQGKSFPAIGSISGVADTLAVLRGEEQYLTDIKTNQNLVQEVELFLLRDWFEVYETQLRVLKQNHGEYTTRFGLWAPGRYYPIRCDFGGGIPPKLFRNCFKKALEKQASYLDYAIFTVNHERMFRLLSEIVKLEGIQTLQILPDVNQGSPLRYLDKLKWVQRKGKGLHLTLPSNEIPEALSNLSAKGLCLRTTAENENQARQIIEYVGTHSTMR
jgi:hypothetical protein